MKLRFLAPLLFLSMPLVAHADGAGDNSVDNVRRIPQAGVAVSDTDRSELQAGIDSLGKAIEDLKKTAPKQADLLPDIQIYYNAARYALTYNEFFSPNEIRTAKNLLQHGQERATQLKEGKAPWTTQTGPIVRGYISKLDGSVQPYGIIVPTSYDGTKKTAHRLDIWYHGRGETLSEVNFLNEHERSMGEFAPTDAFVLHPYGRYCNANRLAGEVDTFEAMAMVKKWYPIDEDRVAVRGFSMGGAACWTFATHFSGDWAAANPGAGFSETADFLKITQNEPNPPTWFEMKLWHMYDSIDYAINLFNCPTVAYSGELDGQRQAAEMMVKAMASEGLTLTHIIGPGAHHFYEKTAKADVAQRVDALVAKGRDNAPPVVKFTTWTLKYNRMKWITVDAMNQEWERARVNGEVKPDGAVALETVNVSALTLNMPAALIAKKGALLINGQKVTDLSPTKAASAPDKTLMIHLRNAGSKWTVVKSEDDGKLAKRHDLQGPIDDAFMESFLMVRPTGLPMNDKVDKWTQSEMAHAVEHWRRQFRGEARIKDDRQVTTADIANSNLILWGDPRSNAILAQIASQLPIRWEENGIHVGAKTYAADHNAPVLIYPNPLNKKRYIVINSGFTFREYDYLNNARQTPKLPDWAIVDLDTPPSSRWPGKIVDADFFGEKWELKQPHSVAQQNTK